MKKNIVCFSKESLTDSILSDLFSFLVMFSCILISAMMESDVWTFLTIILFAIYTFSKIGIGGPKIHHITTKAEAIKWANDLPDDGE